MKLADLKKEVLKDEETRKAYEEMKGEYEAKKAVYEARKNAGMSQEALSAASGVPGVTIARIESGSANTSVDTLAKIAQGIGKELRIEFA